MVWGLRARENFHNRHGPGTAEAVAAKHIIQYAICLVLANLVCITLTAWSGRPEMIRRKAVNCLCSRLQDRPNVGSTIFYVARGDVGVTLSVTIAGHPYLPYGHESGSSE